VRRRVLGHRHRQGAWTTTSADTTATGSRPWAAATAPPSSAKQPTCGRAKPSSASSCSATSASTRPSRSWIASRCRSAASPRGYRCRRLAGLAASGRDEGAKQTFSGLRAHLRVCWPGGSLTATSPRPTCMTSPWRRTCWLTPVAGRWVTGPTGAGPEPVAGRPERVAAGAAVPLGQGTRAAPGPPADSSTAAGRDRDRSARSSATTPRGSGPAMPGSCGHAGSASRSATPWPSTCASRPAWAHSASPTSSPPETRTPGQLGSTGGSGHDHHGLAWRLGRLRPVAMEVALEREVAHLALDHPRPGPQPAWGSRWRSASATACRVALASRRGETRPGR
jgi:hypothetical protein